MSNARFGLRTRTGQISDIIQNISGAYYLLDAYTNAAAAYSLRKLRTAYTGSAIRVRRSNDNAEQDIGFDGSGNLDTSSLSTFVGANNGFVTIWYDQSGNANDATQTTAANQPKIYDSSTGVVLDNGKPAVKFDGSNDSLKYTGNFLGGSAASAFSVSKFDNATRAAREIIYGLQDTTGARYDFILTRQANNAPGGTTQNGIDFYVEGNFQQGLHTITDVNQHLLTAVYSDTVKRDIFDNGTLAHSYSSYSLGTLTDGTDFLIGEDINGGNGIDGKVQEIVVYASDQSASRTGIETNINDYYAIY